MKWASRGSLPFMKMLYPRKIDDVLWHSATSRFSKSILVKMPRLPTIRVIGSQFISTRLPFLLGVSLVGAVMVLIRSLLYLLHALCSLHLSVILSIGSWMVSGGQFSPRMTPLGFFVHRGLSQGAQSTNRAAIGTNGCAGDPRARWLIHEGHELIRKAGHGAANADATHIGAAADSSHPAALGNIAVHNRPPASQLHDALRGAVHLGKVALLIVASSIAALMDGPAEQPRGTQLIVKRNHGRQSRHLVEQVEHGFHEVVGLHRASRNVDDGQAGFGLPVPAEIIRQTHRACGIALHGMNPAVGSTCSASNHRQGFRCQTVDPLVSGNRLAGFWIGSERRPVPFLFYLFVGDRAFDHKDERLELALLGH